MSRNLLTPSARLLLVFIYQENRTVEGISARQIKDSDFKMRGSQVVGNLNSLASHLLVDFIWSSDYGKLAGGRPYKIYKINEMGIEHLRSEGLI